MRDRLLSAVSRIVAAGVALLGTLPVALLNALTSRRGYTVERGIPYSDGPRRVLDVYTPDGARPTTPVVVFFHGGSWDSGLRSLYLFVGQALASGGVIAVLPDYRLYPEVTFPAFVEDAAQAVAFVQRTIVTGDGRQRALIVAGHSAGAQIAALVALDRRFLNAVGVEPRTVVGLIGISGPYDFLPLKKDRYKAIFPEDVRPASQPIAFVAGDGPPMLLLNGDRDRTVDPGNTTRMAEAVRRAGGYVREIVYPGLGHLGTLAALARALPVRKAPVRADILAFVREVAASPRR